MIYEYISVFYFYLFIKLKQYIIPFWQISNVQKTFSIFYVIHKTFLFLIFLSMCNSRF